MLLDVCEQKDQECDHVMLCRCPPSRHASKRPSHGWRVVVCAIAAVAPMLVSTAGAHPADRVRMRWEGAEGCPDDSYLRQELQRLLASAEDSGAPVHLVIRVRRTPERFEAAVTDPTSKRPMALHAPTCKELADAVVVVAALMVDPTALARLSGSASGAAPSASSSTAPIPPIPVQAVSSSPSIVPAPLVPRSIPQPTQHGKAWVGLFESSVFRLFPNTIAGVGLRGGLQYKRVRAEVGGTYHPHLDAEADTPTKGATFYVLSADLRGCVDLAGSTVVLSGCAGVEFDRLSGQGYGVSSPGEGKGDFVSGLAGVAAHWYLARSVALRAAGMGVIPLSHPDFVLLRVGSVYQPAEAGLRFDFGFSVDVW